MNRVQVTWLVAALGFVAVLLLGVLAILFPIIGHVKHMKLEDAQRNSASVIPAKNWKRFYSEEGKFSVRFPGHPQFTNDFETVGSMKVAEPMFFVWSDPQTEYLVNYTDYWNTQVFTNLQKLTAQQQFDVAEYGIATTIGKVMGQKDFMLEGFPARDFDFVAGGKANYSGKERLILANGRLYQMMVIYYRENPHPDDFKLFFSSFSLSNTNS